jgi:hypothetical protein
MKRCKFKAKETNREKENHSEVKKTKVGKTGNKKQMGENETIKMGEIES